MVWAITMVPRLDMGHHNGSPTGYGPSQWFPTGYGPSQWSPTGYGIVEDVQRRGAVIGDSRIELILCKFERIWTRTRLPLWPWKAGQMKILVLRNVPVVFWEVPRIKIAYDSSLQRSWDIGKSRFSQSATKIIETAKRHIATIWPSYHQKMKSLASILKEIGSGNK
jgi:hypothetical protein